MATLVVEGLTLEQAKEMAHWYEGQGEQDIDIWFDARRYEGKDLPTPMADMDYPGGCIHVDKKNNRVTLHCRSVRD